MNVLLTGANGFIGRYLVANLVAAGHRVIPAVRDPAAADLLLPAPTSVRADFNRDIEPEHWLPRLDGIDAVVNCVGILQSRPGQFIQAIHAAAPIALFRACQAAGVRRVIQISAISADDTAGTAYARSKRAADAFLMATDLDWIVLRPSLVYAAGAYGGTALLRALAVLPWVVPLVGKGEQAFQPLHVSDLVTAVRKILETPSITQQVIEPVGPDRLTLRQILLDLRRWLGAAPGRPVEVPLLLVRLAARFGDIVGGPINTTALRQLLHGNAGAPEKFTEGLGFTPRRWHDALLMQPAQAQDRWHARLYFVRPALRWSLAIVWLASGLIGLGQSAAVAEPMLTYLGMPGSWALPGIWLFSVIDIAVGLAILARWRPVWVAAIQLALVALFTTGLTLSQPELWLGPFGPLVKNLPIAMGALVLAAIETDR